MIPTVFYFNGVPIFVSFIHKINCELTCIANGLDDFPLVSGDDGLILGSCIGVFFHFFVKTDGSSLFSHVGPAFVLVVTS